MTEPEACMAGCRSAVDLAYFHLVTFKLFAKRSADGKARTGSSPSEVNVFQIGMAT
jgi:hypothetical protein